MQALEGRPRLDSELLEKRAPRFLVRVQGLRLAPRAVEREHQLSSEPLSERMVENQPFELAEELRVPTELELGVDPVLDDAQP